MSMHGKLRSTRLWPGRLGKLHVHVTVVSDAMLPGLRRNSHYFMCMSPLSVMLICYLDSGETRIIKIRISKKNIENVKNRNILYMQKFLALRYLDTARFELLYVCSP